MDETYYDIDTGVKCSQPNEMSCRTCVDACLPQRLPCVRVQHARGRMQREKSWSGRPSWADPVQVNGTADHINAVITVLR